MPEHTLLQPTTGHIPVKRLEHRPDRPHAALLGRRLAVLLAAAALLLVLAACSGSDADPAAARITDPVFGVDETGAFYIGTDRCLSCHENPGKVDSIAAAADYLASRHARPGTVGAEAAPECLGCHDPIGDGVMLGPWFSDLPQPLGGMTAVGCESCHGAGALHLAMMDAHPNPAPDYQVCGRCHTALPPGPDGHGDDILSKYLTSNHAGSLLAGFTFPLCARCHTDQGFRSLGAATAGLDGSELEQALRDAETLAAAEPIQCRTCHDSHHGGLRSEAMPGYSSQFNLCTACHQVFLTARLDPGTGTYVYELDTSKIPFHGRLDDSGQPVSDPRVIWDTHFPFGAGVITGYGIDASAANACTRCHDPHEPGDW